MARESRGEPGSSPLWPFLTGVLAGAAGAVLAQSLFDRRGLDPRLVEGSRRDPDIPPVVFVPGILGSELLRSDGTEAWLNLGNAVGSHDLSLPFKLPFTESRDDLVPGGLLGADAVLPRLFGFTEYAEILELFEAAGFRRMDGAGVVGAAYHLFTYDWRRDLVEAARRLHETLESLADLRKDPQARFNLVAHSMGGLVARYYLRHGTAEPAEEAPVTWAGARRIRNLVLVATPNAGGIAALDTILSGTRVGFSQTTLSAKVVAGMPAIYQLLPPAGAPALLDSRAGVLAADLHDPATWESFGWGPFGPAKRRAGDVVAGNGDPQAHQDFVRAALARARAFHSALARPAESRCPVRVVLLGGDCLPTLTRAVVSETPGTPPRLEPWTREEAKGMYEAGDGRVPRSSALAAHVPGADESDTGSGLPEISHAFFGEADHHGIYGEPTFQSILLRLLLRPARRPAVHAAAPPPEVAAPS